MDAFITGLMNVASCQFELLKWNVIAIGNENKDSNFPKDLSKSSNDFSQKVYDDHSYEDLRKCIRHNLAIFE